MKRFDAPTTGTARTARTSRRSRLALASTAVVAVLALAACGTDKANADGTMTETARTGTQSQPQAQPQATVAATAKKQPAHEDDTNADWSFFEMLTQVSDPCYPDPVPPTMPVEPPLKDGLGPAGKPPTRPGPVPIDESAPVPERIDTIEPPAELSEAEQCAGKRHADRITKALNGKSTAPDQVRKVLNDLTYDNERIHALKRTGSTTTFALDLRFLGSHLALKATVTAKGTTVEPFWANEQGRFVLAETASR
ncbi:hypothetical protein ABZ714_27740 [Streptomyces sp. NPDC006798]|uniref:hypothetical protein n=1 Tax=Streptomyces sp. NPDC006798 TaxID=3155462 RepID=UPI0033F06985